MTDFPQPDFATKPTLVGGLVTLRPFRLPTDLPAIRALLTDVEAARYTEGDPGTTPRPPWSEEDERRMLAWYGTRHEQDDRLDLAVVDAATGDCVGEVVLNRWDRGNRSCSFRIGLIAAGRDRGLGTEALRLIAGHGFEQLGLHRISLSVYGHNDRGLRCYRKVGFVLEGTRREALRYGDRWVDDLDMAILDHEWERHRGYPAGRPVPPSDPA
ncbi:GNAT family protein [Kitasatospora nipponensis]